jgi:hypothetical protein
LHLENEPKGKSLYSLGFNLPSVDLPFGSFGGIQKDEMPLSLPGIIKYFDLTC